jgi:hypothetical protein
MVDGFVVVLTAAVLDVVLLAVVVSILLVAVIVFVDVAVDVVLAELTASDEGTDGTDKSLF